MYNNKLVLFCIICIINKQFRGSQKKAIYWICKYIIKKELILLFDVAVSFFLMHLKLYHSQKHQVFWVFVYQKHERLDVNHPSFSSFQIHPFCFRLPSFLFPFRDVFPSFSFWNLLNHLMM